MAHTKQYLFLFFLNYKYQYCYYETFKATEFLSRVQQSFTEFIDDVATMLYYKAFVDKLILRNRSKTFNIRNGGKLKSHTF